MKHARSSKEALCVHGMTSYILILKGIIVRGIKYFIDKSIQTQGFCEKFGKSKKTVFGS